MAEEWLKIRNWDKWQSYRKDRGQPPWIKVHRQLAQNIDWVSLTDAQRGQLVAMWILAGCRNGVIPASATAIRKLCFMDSEPDLQLFIDKGFIESGVNVASTWRQDDAGVTPQSREDKSREETDKKPPLPPSGEVAAKPKAVVLADLTFPESLSNSACQSAMEDWLEYKRGKNQSYKSIKAVNRLLERFARDGPEAFCDAVSFSMSQNWDGCYSSKEKSNGHKQSTEQRQLAELDKIIKRTEQEIRDAESSGPALRGLP